MKTRTLASIMIFVLVVLIIAGSCATQKKAVTEKGFYVPESSEGTRYV
jgi:hypothetical protein